VIGAVAPVLMMDLFSVVHQRLESFRIEVCDKHPDLVEFRDNGAAELHMIAGGKGQTLMPTSCIRTACRI
jgi:hypothetical protein